MTYPRPKNLEELKTYLQEKLDCIKEGREQTYWVKLYFEEIQPVIEATLEILNERN